MTASIVYYPGLDLQAWAVAQFGDLTVMHHRYTDALQVVESPVITLLHTLQEQGTCSQDDLVQLLQLNGLVESDGPQCQTLIAQLLAQGVIKGNG